MSVADEGASVWMHKTRIAKNNLKKAHDIKRLGFDSILDSQPIMRDRFIELHQQGFNDLAARRVLLKEFPIEDDWVVPSRQQLAVYVEKKLLVQTATIVDPYLPDYTEMLRRLDPLKLQFDICSEARKLYEQAVMDKAGPTTRMKLLDNMSKAAQRLFSMSMDAGLYRDFMRDSKAMAINNTLINIHGDVHVTQKSAEPYDVVERYEAMKKQHVGASQ